jgi:hypothetical protein
MWPSRLACSIDAQCAFKVPERPCPHLPGWDSIADPVGRLIPDVLPIGVAFLSRVLRRARSSTQNFRGWPTLSVSERVGQSALLVLFWLLVTDQNPREVVKEQ